MRIFMTSKGVTKAEVRSAPEQEASICCVGVMEVEAMLREKVGEEREEREEWLMVSGVDKEGEDMGRGSDGDGCCCCCVVLRCR